MELVCKYKSGSSNMTYIQDDILEIVNLNAQYNLLFGDIDIYVHTRRYIAC